MHSIKVAAKLFRLSHSQWRDREHLHRLQLRRLQNLVEKAYETVPFYRERFTEAGVRPEDLRDLDDLRRLPITTKSQLREADPEAIVSSEYDMIELAQECTSGSTGEPFEIYLDPDFLAERDALFLRALSGAGYRPGSKLMLITERQPTTSDRWLRWRYSPLDGSPATHFELLTEFRPRILYGGLTPVRRLAEYVSEREVGVNSHTPSLVITTAETLNDETRRMLSRTFGAPVRDFYGLSETGMLAWECANCGIRHLSEDTTIVEFHGSSVDDEARRLVVTNLSLRAMPIIRYRTGDLVVPGSLERCTCGRWLRGVERIEGRLVDCLRLPDGRRVSPYRITLSLERVEGIRRYQVVQRKPADILVRYEAEPARPADLTDRIRKSLKHALGFAPAIEIRETTHLRAPPGEKFQVVESRIE